MKKLTTTAEQVKKYFTNASIVNTAIYSEEINLSYYDFESIEEIAGNYYITHKDDLHLPSSRFCKRIKCLFYGDTGFAKILTEKTV